MSPLTSTKYKTYKERVIYAAFKDKIYNTAAKGLGKTERKLAFSAIKDELKAMIEGWENEDDQNNRPDTVARIPTVHQDDSSFSRDSHSVTGWEQV